MNQKPAQVVIIGAGIVGASIAYHLASRGCTEVLLLEREATPITGSTSRSFAGVRHQFSTPLNIRMSQYSIERIKRFPEEMGLPGGLRQVGYMLMASSVGAWDGLQKNVRLQKSLGVPVEQLDAAGINRVVPQVNTSDIYGGSYCPADGFCDPHGIADGYLKRARELGVRLECDTEVTGFQIANGRVSGVETNRGLVACETVVNAAGAGRARSVGWRG